MRFLLLILPSLLLLTTSLSGQITFDPAPGFYDGEVALSIDGPVAGTLYYTLDGAKPDTESATYRTEDIIQLKSNTVVRAAVFDADGEEITSAGATYFIGEEASTLMTISVAIDPWRLFDKHRGWFEIGPRADRSNWKMPGANFWTRAEHPGHLELFEVDGRRVFNGPVGYRMFGGMSRLHPQKSLAVSCRKKYGVKRIKYPVFGPHELPDYKHLVFRNGGSDWSRSHFRDALLTGLLRDPAWDLDHQANRPARLFINGQYWGLYHIREKINETFVADHRGYDKDSLDLLEHQATIKAGSRRAYQDLLLFMKSHGFHEVSTYAELRQKMDVDNFMRLQIAQHYFDNRDAGGNIRYFRPHRPDENGQQRWRWILYDVDYSFGLHDPDSYAHNTLALHTEARGPSWPNPPWSTFIQRKLLENPDYRRFFVNRSLDFLQTDFSSDAVLAAIDEHVRQIEGELPRALDRWSLPMANWNLHFRRLREFARERPAYVRQQLQEFFAAGEDRTVELSQTPGGSIVLNDNVSIRDREWRGAYFSRFPLRLYARAAPGYRFLGWEGIEDNRQQLPLLDLSLEDEQTYSLRAIFAAIDHPDLGQVVVNEIGRPDHPGGAWIEIRNRKESAINLRDWILTDRTAVEVRLPSVTIPPGGYVVFCDRAEAFTDAFGSLIQSDFRPLAQTGALCAGTGMGLYGPRGDRVDEVRWPRESTENNLVRVSTAGRFDDPTDWQRSHAEGTPGEENIINALALSRQRGDLWWRLGIALGILLVLGRFLKR